MSRTESTPDPEKARVVCAVCAVNGLDEEPRYPLKACESCVDKATDGCGRKLQFGNVDMSGGFVARYADNGEPYPGGHLCRIDGVLCRADEHRFGGIVVEKIDLPAARVDMDDARITLPSALTWRFIAEVVRRRHRSHRVRLEQVYPGSSAHGITGLCLVPANGGPETSYSLCLGGGEPGRVECAGPAGSYTLGNVWSLLGERPAEALDRFEEAAGFDPVLGPLPSSTPFVQAHRLVAALLERLVFDPRSWRASLGIASGHSGWWVADWHTALIDPVAPRVKDSTDDPDHRRLSRLVLVHAVDFGACLAREAIPGRALGFDLATGRVVAIDARSSQPLGTIAEMRAVAGSWSALVDRLVWRLHK